MCDTHSKESGNCRLELNYAQQNEDVDTIPLMMEPNYKPRGWLGLIMGTRLYYAFRAASHHACPCASVRELTRLLCPYGRRQGPRG